ncbi:protein phosphatase 2C domain-containing protein [Streptomyces sp. NPDC006326]|uniref:protein phosphatase 2C domain-containing protein n=1 Tax=Streptomyces sp. NPDC006326 TaxID=3156752 RepID=UPI0033B9805B
MSMHRPSGCPSCAEPLEEGDRFCGVCGSPVNAVPAPPSGDRPTLRLPVPGAYAAARSTGRSGNGPGHAAAGHSGPAGQAPPRPASTRPAEAEAEPGAQAAAAHASAPGGYPVGASAGRFGPGTEVPRPGAEGGHGPHASGPAEPAPAAPAAEPAPGWGGVGEAPPTLVDGALAEPGRAAPPVHEATYDTAPGAAAGGPQGKTCVACRAGQVDTDGYCEHCGHAQPRERDHLEEELGSVAAVSDRGLRHHRNEDSFAVAATALPDGSAATVAIVCDGVSSASRPDEASAAAAGAANEALLEALPRGAHPQEAMHDAILAAAAAVNALAPEVPGAQNAPACTLVGAVVSGGLLTIGWVGDSRAYWVPDDRAALPRRLTEDDSWAAQMVAAGLMGEAEAYADVRAHAITGWLGADAYDLEPHTATFKPDHPGVVVVCTDGLWNYAESARDMAQVLPPDAATRPLHSAQVLVGHALDGGGHDNVTVAVVPFTAPQFPEHPAAPAPAAQPEPVPQPGTEPEAAARPQV